MYCKLKNVEKVFEVDDYMQLVGVWFEESELEVFLILSVNVGFEDKFYFFLYCLWIIVWGLLFLIVGVIKQWFESSVGVNVGSLNWDILFSQEKVKLVYESCGGGWYGFGWLGCGFWEVKFSIFDVSGVC